MLWLAAERGDFVEVQRQIESGCNIDKQFKGWTSLMKASEENNVNIVSLLLNNTAKIDAVNKQGRSALSFAAAPSDSSEGRRGTAIAVMQLLLQHGADKGQTDHKDRTPESRALLENRPEATEVFKRFAAGGLNPGAVPREAVAAP